MYRYVLIAMSPLAILAVIAGWFQGSFHEFITALLPDYEMSEHTHHLAGKLGLIVLAFAITGIIIAYFKYARRGEKAFKQDEKVENGFFYKLLMNQYYVPYFYVEFIAKPYAVISEKFWAIDKAVVDGTVDMIAKVLYGTGDKTRAMQNGNLSSYLNWMGAGTLLLILAAATYAVIG
jgi:NADH-quinone oxidoreductase subunit L